MEDKTRQALQILDEWGLLGACGISLLLSVLYFVAPFFITGDAKEFVRALVTNVIPVLLLFATSYLVLRKVHTLRADIDRQELVDAVSGKTRSILLEQFDSLALRVEATSQLVGDWDQKGVERVCTEAETSAISGKDLETTDTFKVIGIGNGWLLKGDQYARLERLLQRGIIVRVLIPDPLSPLIKERYTMDEPVSKKLDLPQIASLVLQWHELAKDNPSLSVKAYTRYPIMNVSVYRDRVLASPILYQHRGKEGLTFVFRRPSIGADLYEAHFDKIFQTGSRVISNAYLSDLKRVFLPASEA